MNLRNKIMLRIYYAFGIKLAFDPLTLNSLFLVFCVCILSKIVSVPDVWANMLDVQVGELMGFLWDAVVSTEIATQVILGLVASAGFTLFFQLRQAFRHIQFKRMGVVSLN